MCYDFCVQIVSRMPFRASSEEKIAYLKQNNQIVSRETILNTAAEGETILNTLPEGETIQIKNNEE